MSKTKRERLSRFDFLLAQLRHRIWFRAALITVAAIVVAALAAIASNFVPFEFTVEIGQDAVGTLLEIIASSMLAVTTFSLTAMVTAYGSATQNATPRSTQLLINDTTSQNALSTFLGAFVFAIVGIIGLQTGIYGEQGRIVLFTGTVALIAVIVLTLLRWISHLTSFGRMSDVIDRVEDAACRSMEAFAADPMGGARPAIPVPDRARPVYSKKTGYVVHVHLDLIESLAEEHDLIIHVEAIPGTLVHATRSLVHVEGTVTDEIEDALSGAFSLERHRTFDHDPRLGLITLAEIGSRALSPAVNDPGTAIEVLNAILRVLTRLREEGADKDRDDEGEAEPASERVYLARPHEREFVEDAFATLVRDGGTQAEVAIRLSKTLAAVRAQVPAMAPAATAMAQALARQMRAGGTELERERFERSHAPIWEGRPA